MMTALLLALTAFSAFAGEIKIFDKPTWDIHEVSDIKGEFALNAKLGRAWVNFVYSSSVDGPVFNDERVQVEGLSYNSETNQIMLFADGSLIVCANVKINMFGAHVKNTGNCSFKKTYYKVDVDNGYEVETVEKLKITLTY